MEKVRVSKKYTAEHISKRGNTTLKVTMPEDSEFFGFHTYVPLYIVSEGANFDTIREPFHSDFEFLLVGKGRKKITWEQFCDVFAPHQTQFDKAQLPRALAFVYDYDYNKYGREESRHGNFVIGGLSEKWFWVSDDDKRRLSAPNFSLISPLTTE